MTADLSTDLSLASDAGFNITGSSGTDTITVNGALILLRLLRLVRVIRM